MFIHKYKADRFLVHGRQAPSSPLAL